MSKSKKNDVRWQLAETNNRLNKLLKAATLTGPVQSANTEIHELRILRDQLQYKLQVLDV